jgi:hypothetical protein
MNEPYDIDKLLSVELPTSATPKQRGDRGRLVAWIVGCITVALLAAVGGLTYALIASLSREDKLAGSLDCVRQSTLIYDDAIANGVKLSVELKVAETEGLFAIVENDDATLADAVRAGRERIIGDGTEANPGVAGSRVMKVRARLGCGP